MKKINTIALALNLLKGFFERSRISFDRLRTSAGLLLLISLTPLAAGPYCIDKQGHSLACPCNCDAVRRRYCIDCTHLQDAQPLTVIDSTQKQIYGSTTKAYIPEDLKHALEKLAAQYVKNKYDV